MKTEIGGDRLGSGNKQEVSLKNYSRSTHDLGYTWRSSMSAGTLVPFMSEVGLPGDSFDIDLDVDVKTLPTIGPLFGSYKVQLDVFSSPIRLFNGKLHMNMLNIGLDMSEIKLPQLELGAYYTIGQDDDNAQINSSSIYSYLNMRGLGRSISGNEGQIKRDFNAVPLLSYWSIYKNYYANKQEERGYVIHASDLENSFEVQSTNLRIVATSTNATITDYGDIRGGVTGVDSTQIGALGPLLQMIIVCKWNNDGTSQGSPQLKAPVVEVETLNEKLFANFTIATSVYNAVSDVWTLTYRDYTGNSGLSQDWGFYEDVVVNTVNPQDGLPQLFSFKLDEIDNMKFDIFEEVRSTTAFLIDKNTRPPYGLGLGYPAGLDYKDSYARMGQEGLGIKTYQSDLLNNWISTEWIDGTNGINEVTAVDTTSGQFTIDSLNLANKVYTMLNRIAISGGSYDDWLDATYSHERMKSCESPIYQGSLIRELAFEEVISQADITDQQGEQQPLGTLAGRGRMTNKNKGGKIKVKIDEPSYVMGIVSITPRIDYSQGNKWDTNLKTMNDLHKPQLDAIGYQDLVTDQMAWFDSKANFQKDLEFQSAGKQPAWINYMTNIPQTRGNFAEKGKEMFMTLNRRYEQAENGTGIEDLTTYIDPSKYNNIFAQTALDSQNFWVQISNRISARRKMSAKVIPNL
jgi:hypothetical protein